MAPQVLAILLVAACTQAPSASPPKLAPQLTALQVHPSQAAAAPGGPVFDGALWQVGATTAPVEYAPALIVGDVVVEVLVSLQRSEPGLTTSMRLKCLDAFANVHIPIGPEVSAPTQGPGYVPLHLPKISLPGGFPLTVNDDTSCALWVTGGGVAGDAVGMATVWVLR